MSPIDIKRLRYHITISQFLALLCDLQKAKTKTERYGVDKEIFLIIDLKWMRCQIRNNTIDALTRRIAYKVVQLLLFCIFRLSPCNTDTKRQINTIVTEQTVHHSGPCIILYEMQLLIHALIAMASNRGLYSDYVSITSGLNHTWQWRDCSS